MKIDTMNEKFLKINKQPDFFYKNMLNTLTELNIEYQIDIFVLLSILLRFMSGKESGLTEDANINKTIERIMKNHEIHNVSELTRKLQLMMDNIRIRKLAGMPQLGGVQ